MAFIRPSSLQLAEKCQRAPWLAHRYPEENERTQLGKAVDDDISGALLEGREPVTPEGVLLIAWLRSRFGPEARYWIQRKVQLFDPETGELITKGTPDLLVLVGRRLYIVDWKTKGQMFAGHLAPPENNVQQQAYLVAAGMEFDAEEAQIILACFDLKGVTPLPGPVLPASEWWPFIHRIKAVPHIDFEGPAPVAVMGEHCGSCYQKGHCTAYLLPAMSETPQELVPFTEGQGLTSPEQVLAALEWLERADSALSAAKRIRELVIDQVNTFVRVNGPIRKEDLEYGPVPSNGARKGPTIGELEELGLTNLIKPGKPGVKFTWHKGRAA